MQQVARDELRDRTETAATDVQYGKSLCITIIYLLELELELEFEKGHQGGALSGNQPAFHRKWAV